MNFNPCLGVEVSFMKLFQKFKYTLSVYVARYIYCALTCDLYTSVQGAEFLLTLTKYFEAQ